MTLRSIQLTQAPPRFSLVLRESGARHSINAIARRDTRRVAVRQVLTDQPILPSPPSSINKPSVDPTTLISTDSGQQLEIGSDGKLFVSSPKLATAQW